MTHNIKNLKIKTALKNVDEVMNLLKKEIDMITDENARTVLQNEFISFLGSRNKLRNKIEDVEYDLYCQRLIIR